MLSITQPTPWYIHRMAVAICIAERGKDELYGGIIKNHNPGDIMGPDGHLVEYTNSLTGFYYLIDMLRGWFEGTSERYHVSMSISEVAKIYTGDDHAADWAANVAGFMGVHPSTTLAEIEQFDQDAQRM